MARARKQEVFERELRQRAHPLELRPGAVVEMTPGARQRYSDYIVLYGPFARRGIVSHYSFFSRDAETWVVNWPFKDRPKQCMRLSLSATELRVVGQAQDIPECQDPADHTLSAPMLTLGDWVKPSVGWSREAERSTISGGAVQGLLDLLAISTRPPMGRAERWANELRRIMRRLRVERDASVRDVLEARAVKLDHLMSVYWTLGR
jgi:hypothetical protein